MFTVLFLGVHFRSCDDLYRRAADLSSLQRSSTPNASLNAVCFASVLCFLLSMRVKILSHVFSCSEIMFFISLMIWTNSPNQEALVLLIFPISLIGNALVCSMIRSSDESMLDDRSVLPALLDAYHIRCRTPPIRGIAGGSNPVDRPNRTPRPLYWVRRLSAPLNEWQWHQHICSSRCVSFSLLSFPFLSYFSRRVSRKIGPHPVPSRPVPLRPIAFQWHSFAHLLWPSTRDSCN